MKALIENEVDIRRSAEDVFDYASDHLREQEWNPAMRYVRKLSVGPVGIGTSYEMEFVPGRPMVATCDGYDRPRSWNVSGKVFGMDVTLGGEVSPTVSGSHLVFRTAFSSRGIRALALPFIRSRMHNPCNAMSRGSSQYWSPPQRKRSPMAEVVIPGSNVAAQLRPTRRRFLKGIGVGAGLVGLSGAGVLGWRASSQGVFEAGQGPAYAAWGEWDQGTGPLALVRAAILAANPHNTQPWRFAISSSAIDVYVDLARNTGAMDPYRREQYIGLGCALENLLIAAQAKGYHPSLTTLPNSNDPTLIAHVELGSGLESSSSLYQAIPRRHTSRAPYDTSRPVSLETLRALDSGVADISGAAVVWITGDAAKRQIGQLIVDGAQAFAADPKQSSDSFRWWRDNWNHIQRYKDGIRSTPQVLRLYS